MALGQLVRSLREAQHYSQGDIAKMAGVSRAWISKVESGAIAQPDPSHLRAIARPLQVHPDQLLTEAGYLRGSVPLDKMTIDDILAQISTLFREVRKRSSQSAGTDDGSQPSVRRQYHAAVAALAS